MRKGMLSGRRALLAIAILAGGLGGLGIYKSSWGSDHQDTAEVELSTRMDINDVYAFPGSSDGRIVLVMTTSSPLTPAQSASATFDPDLLYQIKIDNNGDAIEDLVFQFTFRGTGSNQIVDVRGPVAPAQTGMLNQISRTDPSISGPINTVLGSPSGMQVFAGLRDDPFFIDLEQFFRIIPDRRPVTGPLSQLPDTPTASSFRGPGEAVDYLRDFNCLALIVELPESQVTAGGTSRIGVWGTISR